MPLVRIELTRGRSTEAVRGIADAIHDAIVETYGIPPRDRFQIITQHDAGEIIAEDAGLGFEREDDDVVVVHIFTQRGRTDEIKQKLYARIAVGLEAAGVSSNNVFIGYVENGPQDWSFGFGVAQYLTGELAVPKQPALV